jgi:thiopeptide-type bacteriocin biosynthesis protein
MGDRSLAPRRAVPQRLYQPLGWMVVRAPLLPIERYPSASAAGTKPEELADLAAEDPQVRRALAVGSTNLLQALDRPRAGVKAAARRQAKLLRYLIRMSTRPTPYGLFAGVALGRWGPVTDLELNREPRSRSRPDMAWLLGLVLELESRPEVRQGLRLLAHPSAWVESGRVYVSERASAGDEHGGRAAVSVRATKIVRRILALARTPIPYPRLASELLSEPGATLAKVEALIDQLCGQTILLTDLRPPLTAPSPARHVIERLAEIPAARSLGTDLERLLAQMEAFDAAPAEEGTAAYLAVVKAAQSIRASPQTPVQVDMALSLVGNRVSTDVATEAAVAAELLLRLTPSTRGPEYLDGYRRAFESRYGHDREVPLLEVLDPGFGLGPPSPHIHSAWGADNVDPQGAALRQQTLRDLAVGAIRDRRLIVELDERTVSRLQTWDPQPGNAPTSLDLAVFIIAASREAVDSGDFQLAIGPNLGASAAGRNLGRFADLLGTDAATALRVAARAEAAHAPGRVWAEIVYLPHHSRSANVAVRPLVRSHEIVAGTTASAPPDRVIRLDELSVAVRGGRFQILWPAGGAEVMACTGHMLNNAHAPAVLRFLQDATHDGVAQFMGFDWGSAIGLPFQPRVQVGRIILSPARWLISAQTRDTDLGAGSPADFRQALARWRHGWQVPRRIYLAMGDNRLLLDLDDETHVEELRAEIRRLEGTASVAVQEALPAPDHAWTPGPGGHYITELVVPLVLRGAPTRTVGHARALADGAVGDRLKPPGSDWLYVKLYCPPALEEDLISQPLREFGEFAVSAGLASKWFFLRYSDPDPHVRLRFLGQPDDLVRRLVPEVCSWASELMTDGLCQRFCLDTYDRELERYGGAAGLSISESIFAADSHAVASLLGLAGRGDPCIDRTTLAVLSVDDLLAGLGLGEQERLAWYRRQATSHHSTSAEFRRRQRVLRPLLGNPAQLAAEAGGASLRHILEERHVTLAPLGKHLHELAERGELTKEPTALYSSYVHLHCNRLLGPGTSLEQLIMSLLSRVREGLQRAPLGRRPPH